MDIVAHTFWNAAGAMAIHRAEYADEKRKTRR